MQAGDAVDDGEAEAGAGGVAAGDFQPREGALETLGLACRNAGAAIADFDPCFSRLPGGVVLHWGRAG